MLGMKQSNYPYLLIFQIIGNNKYCELALITQRLNEHLLKGERKLVK